MIAIETQNKQKLMIACFSMLLFLFPYIDNLFAQSTKLHIPADLNSWKPSRLLPDSEGDSMLDSVVKTDFTITMRDGVIIDCLKWVPVRQTMPQGGYPTVIMHHGYGDHKGTLNEFCRLQAQYGYYTMTFSVRGQGLSGGLSNLISTVEADDLIEIVAWIKADSLNGSNPNKILIMGGSQGGAVPMIAAARGMQVAAIINSVAPPDFASSWIENGSIKMTYLWTIEYTPDIARYNPLVDKMSDWVYADTKQAWDSLAYHMPRDRDFVNILQNIQVPVLIEAAWQDKFFNADGWIQHIDKVTSPMSSYLGAVRGHGSDISATEDIWHGEWFNNWFYQWLWNIPTPILDQAKYQYASTTFPVVNNQYFSFVHDSSRTLLRNTSTPLKLYLDKSKKLKTAPDNNNNENKVLKNKVTNNYTLQAAVYSEFTGAEFNQKFKVDTLEFTSNALTADLEWTGTPKVSVDYSSTANNFVQLNYQIYEVTSTGQVRFINRANYTDRNYTRGTRKTAVFNGQAHSHIFKQGSKIKLLITNLDRAHTDSAFFRLNPFVLPTMKNGNHTVYFSTQAYIELPIINASGAPITEVFEKDSDIITNNAPYSFNLSQNYPNPFNPGTLIEYSIASTDKVELKIYDLLGKEVSVLVNTIQAPGSYSVNFNAVNLASGVYFYRLTSGGFTDIKRMVLVK